MGKDKQQFRPRQAPEATSFSWNDGEGTHHAETDADGVFVPSTQAEEDHVASLGWPEADGKPDKPADKPAAPARPAAKKQE